MIPPISRSERGFTLIELLVVITIIAILSVIGLLAYTIFLKNSRDAKRQSDLKLIQSALEDYHADQIYYPFTVTAGSALAAGNKIYLNKVPNDPTAPPDYFYRASGTNCAAATPQNCTSYCLFAQMEAVTLTSDTGCTSLPSGFTSPKAYGVTRP